MEIYPAIDLLNGNCVRLTGGDFNASTVYGDDPVAMARLFELAGARWLHVVDLDGARDSAKRQKDMLSKIVASTTLKVQTGGGVRSAADVKDLLAAGVSRVIIGSLCVKNPEIAADILRAHGPEKITLAFDVRGDFANGFFVTTAGWQDTSGQRIEGLLQYYSGLARHILCTDISRDGMLTGPNTALYKFLCAHAPAFAFQSSGGVAQLSDLPDIKAAGAAGVVIGKALYENRFTLAQALAEVA